MLKKLNNFKQSKTPVVWNVIIWHSWGKGGLAAASSDKPQIRADCGAWNHVSSLPSHMISVCHFLVFH